MKYPKILLCLALAVPPALPAWAEVQHAKHLEEQKTCAKGGRADACKRRATPAIAPIRPFPQPVPALPATTVQRQPPVITAAPDQPVAPRPVTSCDAGGCWDAGANRYNGPAGNTYLDKNGRPCNRNGAWVQCF